MRAVVLGGGGYVGASLAARLRELGHDVVAAVRGEPSARQVALPTGLAHPGRIAELARGADVLYCCAGDHQARSAQRALSWLHIAGVENVTSAARFAGV